MHRASSTILSTTITTTDCRIAAQSLQNAADMQPHSSYKEAQAHLASILPHAMPDMGSRNGSQHFSRTADRFRKKPSAATASGSTCSLARPWFMSSTAANQRSTASLVACMTCAAFSKATPWGENWGNKDIERPLQPAARDGQNGHSLRWSRRWYAWSGPAWQVQETVHLLGAAEPLCLGLEAGRAYSLEGSKVALLGVHLPLQLK